MAEEGMGLTSGVSPVTRVVEVVQEITLNRSEDGEDEADDVEEDFSFDYVEKTVDEEMDEEMDEEEDQAAKKEEKIEYEVKEADEQMTGEEVVDEVEEIFTYVVKDVDQDQHSEEGKLVVDAKQVLMCQYCKTELADESEDARARHRDQCAKYLAYKTAAKQDEADAKDKADDDADEIVSDEEEADAEGDGQEKGNEERMDEKVVPTKTNHASSPIFRDETRREQQDRAQLEEDATTGGDDDAQETKQTSPISSDTSEGHEQQDEQQGAQQDGPLGEDPQDLKPDYSARLRSHKAQQTTPDGDSSASSLSGNLDPPQSFDGHFQYFVDDVGKEKAECLKCAKVYNRVNTRRLQNHLATCDKPKDASKDPVDCATDDEIPSRQPKPSTTQAATASAPTASKSLRQTPQKQNVEKLKKTATTTKPSTPAVEKRKKLAPPPTPRRPPAAKRLKIERKPVASSASKSASQSAKSSTASAKHQPPTAPQATSTAQAKPAAAVAIEDHVTQFEPMEGTQKVRCKHCGLLVALQRKMPGLALERHLQDCKGYAHRLQEGLDLEAQLTAASPDPETAMAILGQEILSAPPKELDAYSILVWLTGSVANASALKSHYGRSAAVVHAPGSRLKLFEDQQLHSLDIPALLAQLTTPVALFVRLSGDNHASCAVEIASQASMYYHRGCAMSFEAPSRVCELLTLPLAIDRGLGAQHCEASVVCGRNDRLDWQCHRMDAFCLQLRGETTWSVKKGVVRHPLRCAHPTESYIGHYDASHAGDLLTQMDADASETEEEDDQVSSQDDEANQVHEAMTEAGSVFYLPAGTWFATESMNDAVWLELRMGRADYAHWLLDSAKHMLWRSPKWRANVMVDADCKTMRSHIGHLLQDLPQALASLTPADLLPEYLTHADTGQEHEWDLTRQLFTGSRHVRVLQSSHFRVNPLARITSLDELQLKGPPLAAPQPAKAVSSHRRNLKALAPVPARVYVMHLLGGEALFGASKLRLQFSCNAFQVALVEWIRSHSHRRSPLFTSVDVAAALQKKIGKAVSQDDDAVKYMLRFLCFAGYLTLVKAP